MAAPWRKGLFGSVNVQVSGAEWYRLAGDRGGDDGRKIGTRRGHRSSIKKVKDARCQPNIVYRM